MKKIKQAIILFVSIVFLILITNQYVFAAKKEINVNDYLSLVEYSEDFNKWVNLSENDKSTMILPKIYNELNTPFIPDNPLYQVNLVGASINSEYNLKNVIPNNISIRNQRDTSLCWAFSGLSSLETNLALNNYRMGKNTDKVYDFSERHVNYLSTRDFANNEINEYGYNRNTGDGGQWIYMESYLTNGQGAISEFEMPFENNSNIINISEIQDKNVVTQLYDTVYFSNYNELQIDERNEVINEIKQHIKNYGSVFASIHGDSSDAILYSCYNNNTGAKYCNNSQTHEIDHAVSIIGWDDNYSIDNFSEQSRPSSNGAWIVRNSWGENIEYNLNELKDEIFAQYTTECKNNGWNSASEIPNTFLEDAGFTISGDKIYISVGDKGYMYVSYEDCNVASTLYGVVKASDKLDYDYIYQYNELYPALQITFNAPSTYICNVFDKKSNNTEYLTEVSLTVPETYTCKVYVNPNGAGKSKEDLQFVQLKAGESETIDVGYHTLEFAEPIAIKSKEFAVVVEIQGTRPSIDILLEGKVDGLSMFDYTKTEKDKCFIASSNNFDTCTWFDLGKLEEASSKLINGDTSIKAFTVKEIEDKSLNRIEISTPPTKTSYIEGEDFNKDGMVVKAFFNNDTSTILSDSDYSIENGNNLQINQEYVTIKYLDKTVNQPITVSKNEGYSEEQKQDEKNEENEKIAQNSDMSNAACNLTNIQSYYYTNDSSKDYTLVDAEIIDITRNLNNDSYEYYYYLSADETLKNITDWVKINEDQTSENKISFRIDSRDIKNFDEISKETTLYIYIKESVISGGNQSVKTTKAIKFVKGNAKVETFVDNAKTQNYNSSNQQQNNDNNNNGTTNVQGTAPQSNAPSQTTNTASPVKLPMTGSKFWILGIIVLLSISLFMFIRYEIINKSLK